MTAIGDLQSGKKPETYILGNYLESTVRAAIRNLHPMQLSGAYS